ncbi:MAG: hypothetical protein BEN18_06970 [Epulopiscium sp. Nuni2H_MBin001]|nr:MAG: hypothetical protein BEN18_06970 [Epulopiscium sp. Nuni2H_MBin001]
MDNRLSNKTKGIIFILIAAFGFALMAMFVKLAGDLPSIQKAFFRNIVGPFTAGILVYKHKASFFGKKSSRKLLLLRSIAGTIGVVFNFYAIDNMVLSDANMINKLSPLFVIIFSYIFLHEKVHIKQAITIIIAFFGALLIIKPGFNADIFPGIVAMLGALSAGAAYTCLRSLGKSEPYYTTVFVFSTLSSLFLLPYLLFFFKPMTLTQLVLLLLAGVCATISQFCITLAYKFAPAKEISIFDYTNVVFAALISWVVFGVLPDFISILGYIIIFAAAFYMFLFNREP